MPVGPVHHSDRRRQPAGVVLALRAGVREVGPPVELELELRRVPPQERRLEEHGGPSVVGGLLLGQAEVVPVPLGLACDRLADVRVDLRQRVVARDPPEGVRERGVDARVVERMARFVEERLVVVQPALRARDQVHHLRRIGGDDARARSLLRAIVEVEPDRRLRQVETEPGNCRETNLGRAILRVGRLER